MTAVEIAELFAYTDWANDRILAGALSLPEERWREELGGPFPTLLDTLTHLYGAEWFWLRRWQGVTPEGPPAFVAEPSSAALRRGADELKSDRAAFLKSLSDADLQVVRDYRLRSGLAGAQPLEALMLHVVNHSTYHRGQAAAMLRRLGADVSATDMLIFNADRSGG